MQSQHSHNSFDFSVRAKAAYLSAFDKPCRSCVAFFVIGCELGKGQAGRVKRLFASIVDLTKQVFNYLSGVGAAEGFAFDVTSVSELVSEGDPSIKLLARFVDRSSARTAHLFPQIS